MATMLAVRAHSGAYSLSLDTVEVPEPGPGEVLVKVRSAGLAPGMMALLAMGAFKHLPTIVGHEAAGEVSAVGPGVEQDLMGARIRVHPLLACGHCTWCRTDREQLCAESSMIGHAAFGTGPLSLYGRYHDGGLAEFVRVPRNLVDVLPANVSFDVGAKVHDVANAMRALKAADLSPGDTLVVTAATGTMGTATVKLARIFGVGRLILVGRSQDRLDAVASLAGDLPVQTICLADLGEDWEQNQGLTRAIRAIAPAGAAAAVDYFAQGGGTTQALTSLALGGRLVHMGANRAPIPIPAIAIMQNMWQIIGTRACTRADTDQALSMLATGALNIDDLITHRFPLAEIDSAMTALQTRQEAIWMAVVNP